MRKILSDVSNPARRNRWVSVLTVLWQMRNEKCARRGDLEESRNSCERQRRHGDPPVAAGGRLDDEKIIRACMAVRCNVTIQNLRPTDDPRRDRQHSSVDP
jgi:hypothetical protein